MPLPQWICGEPRSALQCSHAHVWSTEDLARQVRCAVTALNARAEPARPVGLLADNSPQWISIDLATHAGGVTLVPLPGFFTAEQLTHIVHATGMQALLCNDPELARSLGFPNEARAAAGLRLFERVASVATRAPMLPGVNVQKITFTSGTTGTPKGVCLSARQQLQTARALAELMTPLGISRHMNLLPLSVLLENIGGVYVPLMIGATCVCPSLEEVGLSGAASFDAERCLNAIEEYAPDSVILLPQMLHALVAQLGHTTRSDRHTGSLKFVAVGGAKTPPALIARARQLGVPVYEGYGLSECASVVALNVPGADKPGTVGRPLPGTQVRVADNGEIEVSGRDFAGYLGMPQGQPQSWLRTGDLGAIDADGFVSVVGRTKNILITSFGRNVSPEWPESLLLESPLIAQVAVFGEARPNLVAVIVAAGAEISDTAIERAVGRANHRLPDYARIGAWLRAAEPFTPRNGLATANDRIRRDAIRVRYADKLNKIYETESEHP